MIRKIAIAATIVMALSNASRAEGVSQMMPDWIAGAWELKAEGRWGDEFWTPARGGIMIGSGRVGKGEKLTSFESMRIGPDEQGKLAFWAFPQWKEPVKFPLVRSGPTEVVFENPAHDYPQRVRYWREGKMLHAEISLIDGSKAFAYSFKPMGMKE